MQVPVQDILVAYPDAVLLKRGGQKVVYRARHPSYGDVVIKIGVCGSGSELARIEREVSILRNIQSEYYPRNYDFNLVSGDRFVVLEEYIPSCRLTECFGEYREPARVIALALELVTGLRVLWDNNIVHRDIKPDNILICQDGCPKIIDLGIARPLDQESLTLTLALVGPCTVNYAAPELLNYRKRQIDHRTDQFSLGIVLAQLLLGGRHPFDPAIVGTRESIPLNILNGKWGRALVEAAEPGVMPFLGKLLGQHPHQRYRLTDALMGDLERLHLEVTK